jgi:DNA-binding MarR family transcriptional regulator
VSTPCGGRLGTVTDGVDAIIDQWARERPDLDTTAMELFGRVYRISRLSGDAMERCYGRFGITRADFDVLATLRRSGDPFQLSPSRLAASLMLTTGGMTGRLDRLQRVGLVERTPDPVDRRALLVGLTERGRLLVDDAVAAGVAAQAAQLADLPPDRVAAAVDVLREVLASVQAHATH